VEIWIRIYLYQSEKQNPDSNPHQSEEQNPDPDPHQSEKQDPEQEHCRIL
jgi:hypothetical protein